MISRSRYKSILLKEVRGLSERELFKVVRTIHFLKEEVLKEKKGNVATVLKFSGIWKDMPKNKVNVFSEILKEREKFSEGRSIFE